MLFALVIFGVIAAVSFGCWRAAERDLRESELLLSEVRADLAVALGWNEPPEARTAVVLHAIEGGGEAHGHR